jgi:predicted nucleic acid-binding protein
VRLGVDTNVLVQAHVAASPMHERVHAYLGSLLLREGTEIVLSPLVLHEFVHVVADARHRLVTCNPRDYAVFDDLDTIDPCADTAAATPRFNASG